MRDPRMQAYHFDYDSEGRLIQDRDPADGSTTLSRNGEVDNYTITRTTAEGRTATHAVFDGKDGARESVVIGFDGTESAVSTDAVAASRSTTPRGSSRGTQSPDPRFGFFAPVRESSYVTPTGRSLEVSPSRSVVLGDPDDPFSTLVSSSAALTINGRVSSNFFEAATRTITQTSPSGRTSVSTIDAKGRLIRTEVPGITADEYSYDSRGLLETVTHGARITSFGYDARQRLTSITDPLQRTVLFDYDNADRVTKQILPDGREVAFSYDAAGNLISLTPGSRAASVRTDAGQPRAKLCAAVGAERRID